MNLCEKETSKLLRVAVQTLRNWRHLRRGPAYLKLGRAVRYRDDDLMAFIEKHRINPGEEVD
jgi:hypothetical protein